MIYLLHIVACGGENIVCSGQMLTGRPWSAALGLLCAGRNEINE